VSSSISHFKSDTYNYSRYQPDQKPDHLPFGAALKCPPELAEIVHKWPTLPDHIRAAILALIQAAGVNKPKGG
jgi:hypothetical protein